jgi:hypothetical protein
VPQERKRLFVYVLRNDLAAAWGMPSGEKREKQPFRPLAEVLLPPNDPRCQAAFSELASELERLTGAQKQYHGGAFTDHSDRLGVKGDRSPVCAWKCGGGGFGERAFVRAVPAIKVFGEGP